MRNGSVLSNVISSQLDHSKFGGVVPELASRLHQQNIIKVVTEALEQAKTTPSALNAIAFTRGPGLMGSLLVGTCFAKSFAWGLGIPLIEVNHMQAHVLANFINKPHPEFPFLCLTVSGGHTQIVLARDFLDMEIVGQTIDDAAGEAYDKAAKMMGLPYPGGPEVDKLAQKGNPGFHAFPTPKDLGLDFTFSGLKTSLLYFLRDQSRENPNFVAENINDICASFQDRVVSYLIGQLEKAAMQFEVKHLAIAGGVSANSALRSAFKSLCEKHNWVAHIPDFQYCTDNAGMIGIAAHYKYKADLFCQLDATPFTRE